MTHRPFIVLVGISAFIALSAAVFAFWPRSTAAPAPMIIDTPQLQLAADVPEPPSVPVRLLFFGDMMLGRNVETLMRVNGEDYPFEKIQSLIDAYDFVHANLEGPIVEDHTQTPDHSVSFNFSDTIGPLLARHGFDAVTLANNHTLDQGHAAYVYTLHVLDEVGILHSGHAVEMGLDHVLKTDAPGIPMIFASFNVTFPFSDADAAVETIAQLETESDDPIIVNVHWGEEYQTRSNLTQQELAHRLVDAGADLIIGHHPHVVQESEIYNGVQIFYSLGNFIFDQYFSEETQRGLAVGVEVLDGVWTFTTYDFKSVLSQPILEEIP